MRRYIKRIVSGLLEVEVNRINSRFRDLEKKVFIVENPPKMEIGKRYEADVKMRKNSSFVCVNSSIDWFYGYTRKYDIALEDGIVRKNISESDFKNIKEIKCK